MLVDPTSRTLAEGKNVRSHCMVWEYSYD